VERIAHWFIAGMAEPDLAVFASGNAGRGKANGQHSGGKDNGELCHFPLL